MDLVISLVSGWFRVMFVLLVHLHWEMNRGNVHFLTHLGLLVTINSFLDGLSGNMQIILGVSGSYWRARSRRGS